MYEISLSVDLFSIFLCSEFCWLVAQLELYPNPKSQTSLAATGTLTQVAVFDFKKNLQFSANLMKLPVYGRKSAGGMRIIFKQ